jgi:hypothetical protein
MGIFLLSKTSPRAKYNCYARNVKADHLMTILKEFIVTVLAIFFLFGHAHGQPQRDDFHDQIKNYDLSTILTADSILTEDREDSKLKIKRAEILGFIGDNFQRFHIRFISVIQNPTNPYEYFVYGKTMVKENVCSFQGKIVVEQSTIYKSEDIPAYKQGTAICDAVLYEDRKQPSTGMIKGKLTTNFIIDAKGNFRYDALMFVADGFSNNEFRGTWTSYKTNASKKCNWGDYRIPDSGDLDSGTGEFMVSQKYIKNGWASYMLQINNANKEWWK